MFLHYLSKPQGIILVTGPTGSGKTMTLYAALKYLNTIEKNISTVEDPIEVQLPGINQVNVNPKIGLGFSQILRALLRQDPDIIMVGEIRDKKTANIALQAAQTGHLVLSTLHTNSAIETITRLKSIGIAPYKIASSLSLIIAQRLLRTLCLYCKQPLDENKNEKNFSASGCNKCLNGFQGRIGVYEFFPITEKMRESILAEESITRLEQQIQQDNYLSLYAAAMEKVSQGTTSTAEVNRIIDS